MDKTVNVKRSGSLPVAAVIVAALFCTTGASCATSMRNPFAPWSPPAPEVLTTGASLDQIVTAVNQNSAKIQSYQTNDASVSVPGMPGVPSMRGNIAALRPGRIRLQASTALTGPEVDLGSNDELFWSWVKRSEPPAIYYVRHNQYAGSAAQRLIPIEPRWLLDALGFVQINPAEVQHGPIPIDRDRVEIRTVVQSASGPLTKRLVVDAKRAWVLEQYVYDGSGQLVASAVARSHRYYPEAGISLPQKIDIRVPTAELALTIDTGTVSINTLVDNPQLWTLPVIQGSPAMDLGAQSAAGMASPLGSQLSQADWNNAPLSRGAPPSIAPPATPGTLPPMATLPPSGAAAAGPQTLQVGGVPAPGWDPSMASGSPTANRLPSGGVPAPDLVR